MKLTGGKFRMSKRKYYLTWYVLTASRILLWKATEPSTMPGFNRAAQLYECL